MYYSRTLGSERIELNRIESAERLFAWNVEQAETQFVFLDTVVLFLKFLADSE